jgi:hypothetical protein
MLYQRKKKHCSGARNSSLLLSRRNERTSGRARAEERRPPDREASFGLNLEQNTEAATQLPVELQGELELAGVVGCCGLPSQAGGA